ILAPWKDLRQSPCRAHGGGGELIFPLGIPIGRYVEAAGGKLNSCITRLVAQSCLPQVWRRHFETGAKSQRNWVNPLGTAFGTFLKLTLIGASPLRPPFQYLTSAGLLMEAATVRKRSPAPFFSITLGQVQWEQQSGPAKFPYNKIPARFTRARV